MPPTLEKPLLNVPDAGKAAKLRQACYAVLLSLLLAACARLTLVPPQNERTAAAVKRMAVAGDRMVVVGIAAGAGRTPGDFLDPQTKATVVALERDYRLREVFEWPILSLQLHCVVLEIEGSQSRDALLRKLAADRRVRLAQPLVRFSTPDAAAGRCHRGCAGMLRDRNRAWLAAAGTGGKDFLTSESAVGYLVAWCESEQIGAAEAGLLIPVPQLFHRFALPTGA